jgi:SOS-response transcriptional repressor LexA
MTLLSNQCGFSHTVAMSSDPEIARIKSLLAQAMKRKKIGAKPLARRANLGETAVRDFMKKENVDIRLLTLKKLAGALGLELEDLFAAEGSLMPMRLGPQLSIKGSVAAGKWSDAYEWPEDDWQTFTGRADVTASMMHRFGLQVMGDSMDEIYPEGTIIECVSLFGNAEAAPGKNVVVIRTRSDLLVEATVKQLVEINGELWLTPRSRNPSHQSYKLGQEVSGIVETRIAAIVVASVRPE